MSRFHCLNDNRYFLRNDFIFITDLIPVKDGYHILPIERRNIRELGKYLYDLSRLTNITKVHIIAYMNNNIISNLDILDFYGNIFWNLCNKKLVLHISPSQKYLLKKAVQENPKLREYDSIQFQCDPNGAIFKNGANMYKFNINKPNTVSNTV